MQLDRLVEQIKALPPDDQREALAALGFNPSIVGGAPVAIANHPWQVALIDGQYSGREQFCGGSLIAPRMVVTAAHCLDRWPVNNDAAQVDVLVGTANLFQGGQRIDVQAIVPHPEWARSKDYDVAILRLAMPATQGTPIPLDPQFVDALSKSGTWVTGWGAISEWGPRSGKLRGVEVPVVTNGECSQVYGGGITPRMLCAGEKGLDSCKGDSGGPLVHNRRLIGIVSWGEGCARSLKYGVYTRISSVADWIRLEMGT